MKSSCNMTYNRFGVQHQHFARFLFSAWKELGSLQPEGYDLVESDLRKRTFKFRYKINGLLALLPLYRIYYAGNCFVRNNHPKWNIFWKMFWNKVLSLFLIRFRLEILILWPSTITIRFLKLTFLEIRSNLNFIIISDLSVLKSNILNEFWL